MPAILATTDLSARSDRAIGRAAQLADSLRGALHIVHVIDSDQGALLPQSLIEQTTALFEDHVAALVAQSSVEPRLHILNGSPFSRILDLANEVAADLIVVGAHRHSLLDRIFVGTTGERVMRLGSRPVLRAQLPPERAYDKVMAATDLSDCSAQAMQCAASLRLTGQSDLIVAHIFDPISEGITLSLGPADTAAQQRVEARKAAVLSEMQDFLKAHALDDLPHRLLAVPARIFSGLQELVNGETPDLVVMGTRGQSGLQHMMLGSLAEAAVRDLSCDVLVVPPTRH